MIAYHIKGTTAGSAEMNITQSRADELATQGWLISADPIVWVEKQYVGGEVVDIPKPPEPEPVLPTGAELLARAKNNKLRQIQAELDRLDKYLPRGLEDFWSATEYDVTNLPQVQRDRLARKAVLRAAYAAVEAAGNIEEVNNIFILESD